MHAVRRRHVRRSGDWLVHVLSCGHALGGWSRLVHNLSRGHIFSNWSWRVHAVRCRLVLGRRTGGRVHILSSWEVFDGGTSKRV